MQHDAPVAQMRGCQDPGADGLLDLCWPLTPSVGRSRHSCLENRWSTPDGVNGQHGAVRAWIVCIPLRPYGLARPGGQASVCHRGWRVVRTCLASSAAPRSRQSRYVERIALLTSACSPGVRAWTSWATSLANRPRNSAVSCAGRLLDPRRNAGTPKPRVPEKRAGWSKLPGHHGAAPRAAPSARVCQGAASAPSPVLAVQSIRRSSLAIEGQECQDRARIEETASTAAP